MLPAAHGARPKSRSSVAQLAEDYAAKAGLHRSSNGNIDVLKSAGGIQGIAESILPGLVFLIAFTIDRENLTPGRHCCPGGGRRLHRRPGWSSASR